MDFQVYLRSEEHIEGDHIEFRSHVPLSLTVADAKELVQQINAVLEPKKTEEAPVPAVEAERPVESNVTEMDTRKRKHS